MKKAVVMLLALWVAAGQTSAAAVYAQQRRGAGARAAQPAAQPSTPAPPAGELFAKFPVGEAKRIDLEIDEVSYDGKNRRERVEQVRDWLLTNTVASSGASLGEINQALYDQPSVRHGYMEQLSNFEYGETRSRYVGRGTVIALLPTGSQREADLLARVADQQRKDLGEVPAFVVPFQYRIDLDSNTAMLVRRATIPAAQLFTEAYGYHEARIASLADLNDFMSRVDDVTYADASGGALTLGGRKMKSRAYGRVSVEEAAAVWQSQSGSNAEAKRLRALRKQLEDSYKANAKQLIDDFARRWAAFRTRGGKYLVPEYLVAQFKQEQAQQERSLKALADAAAPAVARIDISLAQLEFAGTGFSLDPVYDYDRLGRCFEENVEPELKVYMRLRPGLLSGADVEAAKSGMAAKDTEQFSRLLEKVSRAGRADDARYLQSKLFGECSIQGARYDGPPQRTLRGTEAGMVLFYTDLIAKLWAIDFAQSTPTRENRDFLPMTTVAVTKVHREELERLSDTRLWFGPLDKGYQVGGEAKERLLLARNSTRVYSASSDPLRPGKETESNAEAAAFLDWWNEHYEDVAQYEPQYERLNEIMKWSLIVGWLNDTDREGLLGFLDGVEIKRDNWFPEWAGRHRGDLKFREWDEVRFFGRGEKHDEKGVRVENETLPLLSSAKYERFGIPQTITGGVSLAGKEEVGRRAPLTPRTLLDRLLRRGDVDLSKAKPGEIQTLEGKSYSLASEPGGRAKVIAAPKQTARMRTSQGELTGTPRVERTSSLRGGQYETETRVVGARAGPSAARVADMPEGSLRITETANGFRIGRQGRDLDLGMAVARRVSGSHEPELVLSSSPDVEAAFVLPGRGRYLIKTRGSVKWMLAQEAEGEASAAQARVADLSEDARELHLRWLDPAAANGQLNGGSVGLRLRGDSSLNVLLSVGERPHAGVRPLEVEKGGRVVRGWFDAQTGAAYFDRAGLPLDVRNDPSQLASLLTRADLLQVRKLAADGAGEIRYAQNASADFATDLMRADRLIAEGNYGSALELIQRLDAASPGRWEVTARKALASLSGGRVEESAQAFEALRQNPSTDRNALYDQIASVLASYRSGRGGSGGGGGKWTVSGSGGDGGGFKLLFQLPGELKGRTLRDAAEVGQDGTVYIQDGLDYGDVPLRNVLVDVISGRLPGTVVRVPRGDIETFNPTVVYDPISHVRFEFKGTAGGGRAGGEGWAREIIRRRPPVPSSAAKPHGIFFACCDDEDNDGVCDGDEADVRAEDDADSCVYFVMNANARPRAQTKRP